MNRIKLFFAFFRDRLASLYMGQGADDYPPITMSVKAEIPPPEAVPVEAVPAQKPKPKKAKAKSTKKSKKD